MMSDIPAPQLRSFSRALPFWLPLGLIPLAWVTAIYGGWSLVILPFATWYLFSFLDFLTGLEKRNADPQTPDADLKWYRVITLIWAPIQIITIYAILWYTVTTDHLVGWEEWVLFGGLGVISGTIGINYSHELMHQKPRIERWLADILLAFVLYSHFRSEHLLVHHRYVGTPKDPVTARFNEHFWQFLRGCCAVVGCRLSTQKRRCLCIKTYLGPRHRTHSFGIGHCRLFSWSSPV
jgi:alkane 1-monooxygenase